MLSAQGFFSTVALWVSLQISLLQRLGEIISFSKSTRIPLPPGPPPLPIIGNLLELTYADTSTVFRDWTQKYGEIVHAKVFGRSMIIVSSAKAANELFEKRSANYSDRNRLHMINDLMGWDWSFGMMPYGERWFQHRKLFHRGFQPSAVPNYWPIQLRETHTLLRNLLKAPCHWAAHLREHAASTIMSVTYGIKIDGSNRRFVDVAETALHGLGLAAAPGAFLVDLFPFLKRVPVWFPAAGFRKKAQVWKCATHEMRDAPFDAAKDNLAAGIASPSFVTNLLSEHDAPSSAKSDEHVIKACAGLAYAASTESTVSVLSSFFLAMILYPDAQRRAQAEIDDYLSGGDVTHQLPEFSDRPHLPYIGAVVKELLRWSQVAPLGLPHMVTNDDVYNGQFIPGGSTIVGFSWGILHDASTYPQPMDFIPERFLDAAGKPPAPDPSSAFGFGRRICPGRHMADATIWMAVASILSVFDIQAALNPDTHKPEPVEAVFTTGMICHPCPFKCTITPRSIEAAKLISETALAD